MWVLHVGNDSYEENIFICLTQVACRMVGEYQNGWMSRLFHLEANYWQCLYLVMSSTNEDLQLLIKEIGHKLTPDYSTSTHKQLECRFW